MWVMHIVLSLLFRMAIFISFYSSFNSVASDFCSCLYSEWGDRYWKLFRFWWLHSENKIYLCRNLVYSIRLKVMGNDLQSEKINHFHYDYYLPFIEILPYIRNCTKVFAYVFLHFYHSLWNRVCLVSLYKCRKWSSGKLNQPSSLHN